MKYVDTNVLIRLLLNDVPELARQAQTAIEQAEPGSMTVLDTVIEEVCTVLQFNRAYSLPRPVIHDVLTLLLDNPAFQISDLARQALAAYGKHPKLDFTDCLLLAAANGHKNKVMTFDKDLLRVLG